MRERRVTTKDMKSRTEREIDRYSCLRMFNVSIHPCALLVAVHMLLGMGRLELVSIGDGWGSHQLSTLLALGVGCGR